MTSFYKNCFVTFFGTFESFWTMFQTNDRIDDLLHRGKNKCSPGFNFCSPKFSENGNVCPKLFLKILKKKVLAQNKLGFLLNFSKIWCPLRILLSRNFFLHFRLISEYFLILNIFKFQRAEILICITCSDFFN